jgi:hypothetical protein
MWIRFFLIFVLSFCSSEKSSDTIEWNEANKLSWADFKGPIQNDSDAAAVTASGITFSYTVRKSDNRITDFEAQVQAHFYPENSWFIKARCNDHILAHEQLHFDITELHARIFRYRLAHVQVSQNLKTQLEQLHTTINQELEAMQKQYDRQSQNSIHREEQAKWNIYVAENLKKFETYKSL